MSTLAPPPNVTKQGPLLHWLSTLTSEDAAARLDLHARSVSDKVLESLAGHAVLEKVQELDLSCNRFSSKLAPVLRDIAKTARVVDVTRNARLREGALDALVDRPWPQLQALHLGSTKLRKDFAKLEHLDAPQLTHLDASWSGFGAAGAKGLASSALLPQLTTLNLRGGKLGASGRKALFSALEHASRVEHLHLGDDGLAGDELSALLRQLPALKSLGVSLRENDDEALLAEFPLASLELSQDALLKLPVIETLRRLRVRGWGISWPSDLSARFRRLEALTISDNVNNSDTMRVLEFLNREPPERLRFLDLINCYKPDSVLEPFKSGELCARLLAFGMPDAPVEEQVRVLERMPRLQALKLSCWSADRAPLLRALNQLESLEVLALRIDPKDAALMDLLVQPSVLDDVDAIVLELATPSASLPSALVDRFGARLTMNKRAFFDELTGVDYA